MSTHARTILVTGAAGNLGQATAHAFRAEGARTVLVDRRSDRLPQIFADLAGSPDHQLAGGVDLTDPQAVDALVAGAVDRFGAIDVLVNAAGGFAGGAPVTDEPLATWDAMMAVNLRTALLTGRAVARHMRARHAGRIVNVAARPALKAVAGLAAYSAAKAAVLRLTEAMAQELKADGITVNAIVPGIIDTPQNRAAMPAAKTSAWVPPAAIAEVIVFLASPAAWPVTGAAIPVSGRQ